VNVGVVRGGEKPNIVPASAECELMFRTVDDHEVVRTKLEQLVERFGGKITLARGNPPQFMVVPEGAPSTVVAFNTDIRTRQPRQAAAVRSGIDPRCPWRERVHREARSDAAIDVYCDTVARLCLS